MPEPYWADEDVTLYLGDCLDVLRTLEADSIDAIVTDPPAGIAFMDREWDDFRRARNPADAGRDNYFGRLSAHGPEYGRRDRGQFVQMLTERMGEAYRVLKPGGHALVWSIPRTSHWTAWAIEDAGFDIRDCIPHLFGSGFPKSLDVGKALSKRAPGEMVLEVKKWLQQQFAACGLSKAEINRRCGFTASDYLKTEPGNDAGGRATWHLLLPYGDKWKTMQQVVGFGADYDGEIELYGRVVSERSAPKESRGIYGEFSGVVREFEAPEDAARWEGWGTALKPGQETWWLARKPLAGTVAANVLEYGAGAINVDACKVGAEQRVNNAGGMGSLQNVSRVEHGYRQHVVMPSGEPSEVTGRWPTNIVFTHSAACEPIGTRRVRGITGTAAGKMAGGNADVYGNFAGSDRAHERTGYADAEGMETVEAWDCAPDCPVAELDRQSGVLTSGANPERRRSDKFRDAYGEFAGQESCTPHRGADSGGASRFYPTFRYQAKAPSSERPRLEDGTAHETVKSLGLMRWLVKLITPPDGLVLDPFAGSGTTAEACIVEGFNCILIEQDPKSAELIKTRLRKPIQPVMFGFDEAS